MTRLKRIADQTKKRVLLLVDRLGTSGTKHYPDKQHFNRKVKTTFSRDHGLGYAHVPVKGYLFDPIEPANGLIQRFIETKWVSETPGRRRGDGRWNVREWRRGGYSKEGPTHNTKKNRITITHCFLLL